MVETQKSNVGVVTLVGELGNQNLIQFLNERYNPFGIKLYGWHDQVQISSNSYDNVFGEIYEKYKDDDGFLYVIYSRENLFG